MLIDVNGRLQFHRELAIEYLLQRDGNRCMYPDCTLPFDPDPNGRHALSIDHIYPQVRAKEDGWAFEQIWDIENLQLMGRSCNAKKSDLLYDENGMLPRRGRTRSVKTERPEWCELCDSGRLLYPGEECPECFRGPQPAGWPAVLQKTPKECSHGWVENDHCWMCVVGHVERKPAAADVFGLDPRGES